MQQGQIRVQTENIFPIIKKFLYSEHDIFIRELVSNAVDATQKIKTLASLGEMKGELGELRIDILLDQDAKTLTIADRGIGMTSEEVDKYLNQVAFSGAEEFLEKYKGQNEASIIGHFGLGFYSAFMVSSKVDVITKSYRDGAEAVKWSCDGSPSFTLEAAEREHRGTSIVLHLNEESLEFLESDRVLKVLEKFCRFLPAPIFFEEKQINQPQPAWTKKPSELTQEDYQQFYRELYPFSEPPLFWIHLNVDYPFNLTGILYFPKIKQSYEIQKDKIQLYCNQVFVTEEVKDIVPEFLMLLHGVIDSPDIPLNVSRSYLQGDPNVKKINAHITKKVADKLEEIFNNDRKSFEEKWESLGLFVKYGMMTDDKFLDKANRFFILENTSGEFHTMDSYKEATSNLQKNKDGKHVILYTTNPVQQDGYIQQATARGYQVVKMETLVDAAFINNMEMKWSDVQFTRVDAEVVDHLIDKQENIESVLSEEDTGKIKEMFNQPVEGIQLQVEVKGMAPDTSPVTATRPELMRRMKDMASMGGGMASWYANMPDEVQLTINGNHPLCRQLLSEDNEERRQWIVRQLTDLSLLSQGLLKGAELSRFVERSMEKMLS